MMNNYVTVTQETKREEIKLVALKCCHALSLDSRANSRSLLNLLLSEKKLSYLKKLKKILFGNYEELDLEELEYRLFRAYENLGDLNLLHTFMYFICDLIENPVGNRGFETKNSELVEVYSVFPTVGLHLRNDISKILNISEIAADEILADYCREIISRLVTRSEIPRLETYLRRLNFNSRQLKLFH